ncbi:MAG: ammonia channel protein, partial [Acidobacteria bacterium]
MFADKRVLKALLTWLFLWTAVYPAFSQTSSSLTPATVETQTERIARLEQAVIEAKSSADNSWMLVSSALVLLMTGPGLAL